MNKISSVTRLECLEEIIRLADINGNISRDKFRKNSKISESAYEKHFGSFSEYKRAAGLLPTRGGSSLKSAVAKHASVDGLQKINQEKREYSEKYLRPKGNRFQTVLVGSDIHDIVGSEIYKGV